MSFETGVFPVLVSENESLESLSPQVRGGLNTSSATPLHVQLSDLMRVKILSEDWKAGTYIPSEAEFMTQYGVSRGTIRKAIQSLVKEGLLITQKGRATQVISNTVRHAAGNTVLSFAAALRDGGFEYRTEVLFKQVVPADQAVAEHLEIPIGSDVLFLRRVRSHGPTCLFVRSSKRQTLRMSRSSTRLRGHLKKRLRALACAISRKLQAKIMPTTCSVLQTRLCLCSSR